MCRGNIWGNILEKQEHAEFERKNGSREQRTFDPERFPIFVRRSPLLLWRARRGPLTELTIWTTCRGELRHRVAITRGPGHRCRNSRPEDQPSVARNSQQNSQHVTP